MPISAQRPLSPASRVAPFPLRGEGGASDRPKTVPGQAQAAASRNKFGSLVLCGMEGGASYALNAERVAVGRAPGNDIVLRSRSVSAHHAVIEVAHTGAVSLRDLGSRNGTFANDTHLNGNGVNEAHAAILSSGDYVRFGYDSEVYQFAAPGDKSQQKPATLPRLPSIQPTPIAEPAPTPAQPEKLPPASVATAWSEASSQPAAEPIDSCHIAPVL